MFVTGGWGSASPNLGLDPAFAAITGLNLSFPVFHWGERRQTDKQYKAYVTAQKLQESLAIDQIKEELAGARAKIQESMNQVRTARENIGLAEENLDLVTFTYNEGKASIVDVLSAQLSWTQAKSNVVNAWLGHKLALAEYKKVVSY
jgi:outer membrane protein TolC